MNINEVFELLDENKNQRGIDNWNKLTSSGLKSYGIGLTVLRKLMTKFKSTRKAKESTYTPLKEYIPHWRNLGKKLQSRGEPVKRVAPPWKT